MPEQEAGTLEATPLGQTPALALMFSGNMALGTPPN